MRYSNETKHNNETLLVLQGRENVNVHMWKSLASTKTTWIKPLDKKHRQTKVEWTNQSEKVSEAGSQGIIQWKEKKMLKFFGGCVV